MNYPERTEEQERERREAEDRAGEYKMEYEREMQPTTVQPGHEAHERHSGAQLWETR